MAKVGSKLAEVVPKLAEVGPKWGHFDHFGVKLASLWPSEAGFGPFGLLLRAQKGSGNQFAFREQPRGDRKESAGRPQGDRKETARKPQGECRGSSSTVERKHDVVKVP